MVRHYCELGPLQRALSDPQCMHPGGTPTSGAAVITREKECRKRSAWGQSHPQAAKPVRVLNHVGIDERLNVTERGVHPHEFISQIPLGKTFPQAAKPRA